MKQKTIETYTFCAAPLALHLQLQTIIAVWKIQRAFSSEE